MKPFRMKRTKGLAPSYLGYFRLCDLVLVTYLLWNSISSSGILGSYGDQR